MCWSNIACLLYHTWPSNISDTSGGNQGYWWLFSLILAKCFSHFINHFQAFLDVFIDPILIACKNMICNWVKCVNDYRCNIWHNVDHPFFFFNISPIWGEGTIECWTFLSPAGRFNRSLCHSIFLSVCWSFHRKKSDDNISYHRYQILTKLDT